MVKKTTLNELGSMLEHVVKHMATKEDVADQLNQKKYCGMKHSKLEFRVADLEEKVFGKVRA